MRLLAFSLFLILLNSITLLAQEDTLSTDESDFNVKRAIRDAKRSLRNGDVYGAADIYKTVLDFAPERTDIAYELATAYRISRDYQSAAYYYQLTDSMDEKTYPLSAYYAGLMLKMRGRCNEAIPYFETFYKRRGDFSNKYRQWAKLEIEGCELKNQLIKDSLAIDIIHLDSTINSPYTDISPLLWDDTTLIYASLPSDTVIVLEDNFSEKDYFIKFFKVDLSADTLRSKPFDQFTEEDAHVANGAFSTDKKRFYFTKCYEDFNGIPQCAIYVSKLFRGKWTYPEALPESINFASSNSTHPTIAPYSGGREILYFVSDRAEGKGSKDIWYSIIQRNGSYSEPKNAGNINTSRDEATPFYDTEQNLLFFSSNGLVGIGGYDVFQTTGDLSRWETPKNIGYPVNSSADDMYYRTNEKDRSTGYLVSNRPGIISIRSETCCDDIFRFEYKDKNALFVKGYVYEEGDPQKKKINDALVELIREDTTIQDKKALKLKQDTTENDNFYFFQIKYDKAYRVVGSKEGYLSGSNPFDTKIERSLNDTLHVDIYLKRYEKNKAYQLRNVYYDYDKWFLREASKNTLDTLYNIMLDNPGIIVEIGSHTDTRGSDSYNIRLSQKRAESCVQYLIDKGISANRLLARGYGETRLIREGCAEIEGCPEEGEGDCPCHQANRRTEFRIVGELDGELKYQDQRYKE